MTTSLYEYHHHRIVVITGGGGFLGRRLASYLMDNNRVDELLLVDIQFPAEDTDNDNNNNNNEKEDTVPRPTTTTETTSGGTVITKLVGDISNTSFCDSLFSHIRNSIINNSTRSSTSTSAAVSIFHLGGVMSGDGERDFDLCIRVNLHGCLNMLEGTRALSTAAVGTTSNNKLSMQPRPKFIFTSSGFTIGSGTTTDYISQTDVISDSSKATPHTTYGATKACCEILLSDYARRGYVDGRAVRLPTIIVRGGVPNAATTSCFSAIVREPLAGIDVKVPIANHVPHAVTSVRAAIGGIMTLHDVEFQQVEQVLGYDRTVFLPAVAVTLQDLQNALYRVVTTDTQNQLGNISHNVDDNLSAIVGSFPSRIDATRAHKLGIPPAPTDAEVLVREYIEELWSSCSRRY